jgi:FrmR/RcnR family transcriptional regulator, repressor of frmRAB operon
VRAPSQVFGNGLELVDDGSCRFAGAAHGEIEAVVDVVMDQRSLRLAHGLLDRMKLLGQIEIGPAFVEHLDDATKMALGSLQPFDDFGMGFVNVNFCHPPTLSPGGINQPVTEVDKARGGRLYCRMSHTVREKKKLLARVRRIRGQVEAIERALGEEAECERIMHMIAGIRGSVAGLMAEVVEDHIRTHLVDPQKNPGALNADAADQLIEVVHTYLK